MTEGLTIREMLAECVSHGLIRLSTPKEERIERDFIIVRELESCKPIELIEIVIDVNDFYLRNLALSNCREELQTKYSSRKFGIEDYNFINIENSSFPGSKKRKSSDYL